MGGRLANTFKLTKNYRFELYYWDYGLGIFLMSLIWALTLGSVGGGPLEFSRQYASGGWREPAVCGAGWIHLHNIANVLLIAGIEIVGLAIAFPISIGIALVEGVLLSYMLKAAGQRGTAVLQVSGWRSWQ